MLIRIEGNKIKGLLKDFYNITGLRIGIFDLSCQETAAYPVEICPLCALIRSSPEGAARCRRSDAQAFAQCARSQKLHLYQCHAGLTEAAFPILYENKTIAYIMIGQILNHRPDGQGYENIAERLPYLAGDRAVLEQLRKAYDSSNHLSDEKILSAARIMEACASYIRLSEYIYAYIGGCAALVKAYIDAHFREKLTIGAISRQLGIGRTTVCERFREAYGTTVNSYLAKIRIEHAKQLLLATGSAISCIAGECGFADYNYFIKQFRRQTGITPAAMRKAAAKQAGNP